MDKGPEARAEAAKTPRIQDDAQDPDREAPPAAVDGLGPRDDRPTAPLYEPAHAWTSAQGVHEVQDPPVGDHHTPEVATSPIESWANFDYVDFGYSRWGRGIALVSIAAGGLLLAFVTGAWPFPEVGEYLGFWHMVMFGAFTFIIGWALLGVATSHIYMDTIGLLLVAGKKANRVAWEDVASITEKTGEMPGVEIHGRWGVVMSVGELESSSRGRDRLVSAVTACRADPAIRPTGVAPGRTFPVATVAGCLTAVSAGIMAAGALR